MDYAEVHWDAIVVGTGMGGATAGYALAKAGKRVLFCEKGLGPPRGLGPSKGLNPSAPGATDQPSGLRGDYPENMMRAMRGKADAASLMQRAGRCTEPIDDVSFGATRSFVPFIGSGAGGSSALYGMALERFLPADFEPARSHPDATTAALPERWPIPYAEFEPYYRAAEQLFRVRSAAAGGTAGLAPANVEVWERLTANGLHPYRLPLACEVAAGCKGCQGFLCERNCKNDSGRMCLEPALTRYGAHLLERCTVTRLLSDGDRVTGLDCTIDGRPMRLKADTVLLAAGALATPALLLTSASAAWPDGLANRSGLVGRHLMRHCIDLYAIAVRAPIDTIATTKEIAFNDFYAGGSFKLGSVQSFGPMPSSQMLVDSMQEELTDAAGRVAGSLFGIAKPLLRPGLERLFSKRIVLAAVMEDLPYPTNRVTLMRSASRPASVAFHYRLQPYERARVALFRKSMQKALSPHRFLLLKQAENNRRLAHVCGTCRFGNDPASSVLDRNNKAHDLANLYVVDASFFPTSGGTNPALTIAANALRVAESILGIQARTSATTPDSPVQCRAI